MLNEEREREREGDRTRKSLGEDNLRAFASLLGLPLIRPSSNTILDFVLLAEKHSFEIRTCYVSIRNSVLPQKRNSKVNTIENYVGFASTAEFLINK